MLLDGDPVCIFLSIFSLFILLLVLVVVSDFNDDDCDVDFGTITRLGDLACDLAGDLACDLVGDLACDLVGDFGACLLDLNGDDDDLVACRPVVETPFDGTVLDGDFDA